MRHIGPHERYLHERIRALEAELAVVREGLPESVKRGKWVVYCRNQFEAYDRAFRSEQELKGKLAQAEARVRELEAELAGCKKSLNDYLGDHLRAEKAEAELAGAERLLQTNHICPECGGTMSYDMTDFHDRCKKTRDARKATRKTGPSQRNDAEYEWEVRRGNTTP